MKSVLSNKVEIRNSGIDKKGMYAKEKISKGEIVYIKGGHILTRKELFSSSVINSYLPISDNYFIGAISSEEEHLPPLPGQPDRRRDCRLRQHRPCLKAG